MPETQKLTLRAKLLLLVMVIVLVGFAATLSVLTGQASTLQQNTALQYTQELAANHGSQATSEMVHALDAARTLGYALGQLKATGTAQRASADALLKGVLAGNPTFLGVWSCWEPNAFDGKDSEYANQTQTGHDASGRYIPYWNRGSGSIAVEPLADYDKPGAGDYYLLPKKTGDETVLEPYLYPVGGQQVLMTSLVVPIKVDGKFVGVAGIDIALSSLQQTIEKIRIYDTGYATLISHGGIFVGDRDPKNVGKDMDKGGGLDAARTAIHEGRRLQTTVASEQSGGDATRVYVPVRLGASKTPWSFAVTVPNAEMLAGISQLRWTALALGVLSIVLVSIGLGLALERLVLRPIGGEPDVAAGIAARVALGDLSQAIRVRPNDQTSLMAQLQRMQDSLSKVVSSVRQGAEGVATASTEIAQGNQDLSGRTESQASALQQTSASMEQLGSTVTQNADSARHANDLARSASTVAAQGGEAVALVIETMKDINDSSRKIADIIGVIDSIAFQTNILALNAAVEAARAGEQGRGFAVVASEVRSLAGRSSDAAKEIRQLINASVGRVEVGASQVDQAGSTMTEVVKAIQRVTDIMGEISAASAQQSAGVGQVGEAITQMDQATQQNAALVEEMAAAASSLKMQAQELVQTVAVFQIQGFSGSAAQRPAAGPRTPPAGHAAKPVQHSKPASKTPTTPPRPALTTQPRAASVAPQPRATPKAAQPAGKEDDWESF